MIKFIVNAKKVKMASFKSSENENWDGPYRCFGYSSFIRDPINLPAWRHEKLLSLYKFQIKLIHIIVLISYVLVIVIPTFVPFISYERCAVFVHSFLYKQKWFILQCKCLLLILSTTNRFIVLICRAYLFL